MRGACAARDPTKADSSESFPVSATVAWEEADASLLLLPEEAQGHDS